MGYVLKAVLSSAQHPEYGQITVPFPIPDEKYDRMIELLEPLEIGDALRQDCRVDELDSFYTVLNRLVGSLVNFDELDYLAKRLDSFDDGEAAQFQGMACKLGVSNIKDFINLTFCCQQATVITDFSDLDAIGRQHYMTMQGGGCRIEELERLDGRKFALDLILNHLEGRITPYGVVYDRKAADPSIPHTYAWFVMADTNTPQEIIRQDLTLEEAIQIYQDSNTSEKRLGVIKDGIATVDFVHFQSGEQQFFTDHEKLESFRSDLVVAEAMERLYQQLNQPDTCGKKPASLPGPSSVSMWMTKKRPSPLPRPDMTMTCGMCLPTCWRCWVKPESAWASWRNS